MNNLLGPLVIFVHFYYEILKFLTLVVKVHFVTDFESYVYICIERNNEDDIFK